MALKEEKSRLGISLDGNATLRRNAVAKQTNGPMSDLQKMRRQNVDSGYSTSDGYDKRWLEDGTTAANGTPSNGAPSNGTPLNGTTSNGTPPNGAASNGTPSITTSDSGTAAKWSTPSSSAPNQPAAELSTPNLSPVTQNNNNIDEYIRPNVPIDNSTPKRGAAITISNKTNTNRFVGRALDVCEIHAFSSMASITLHLRSLPCMLHHIANHFTSRNTSICQFHRFPPRPPSSFIHRIYYFAT